MGVQKRRGRHETLARIERSGLVHSQFLAGLTGQELRTSPIPPNPPRQGPGPTETSALRAPGQALQGRFRSLGQLAVGYAPGQLPEKLQRLAGAGVGPPGVRNHFPMMKTVPDPDDPVGPIHDRMPVILDPKDFDRWLDPDQKDPAKVQSLLRPYPAEALLAYPVSRLVNDPKHEDPGCLEPQAPAPVEPPQPRGPRRKE
jgi:SOS response associated peptidase (SRAP)